MTKTIAWLAGAFSLAAIQVGAAAQTQAAPVHPFGMCSNGNMLSNPDYPVKLLDAGADMVRLDMSFGTVRANPGDDPDKWNWKPFEQVRALRAKNPKLKVLAILGYGTKWAMDPKYEAVGGDATSAPQRGIDARPVESPENLYGHYVYEAVRRYKDVIDTWESWNEPDLNGHAFFKGNGKDFMPYQRTFYLAAKKADPNCKAIMAGLCFMSFEGYLTQHKLNPPTPYPPTGSFLDEFLAAVAADPDAAKNNFYFDAMNQHSYSRATDLYDYVAVSNKAINDYLKTQKPFWITEMGITDKGGLFGGTPDEYCDYVLQSYAWGSLAGLQKFFHFQLDNSNGHGLYSGMLGEPKPVLTTYRDVLTAEFAKAKFVKQLHGNAGVGFLEGNSPFKPTWQTGYNAFEFRTQDQKKRLIMAFADKAEAVEVSLPAVANSATLVDRHNNRTKIQAKDGKYTVKLAGATNVAGWPSETKNEKAVALGKPEHLVGGATVVLIEDLP